MAKNLTHDHRKAHPESTLRRKPGKKDSRSDAHPQEFTHEANR